MSTAIAETGPSGASPVDTARLCRLPAFRATTDFASFAAPGPTVPARDAQ